MSLLLMFLLFVLLFVNYVIGFVRGIVLEGFDMQKFKQGGIHYLLVAFGFGALACFAFFAGKKFEGFEYLSGILLDPIARYFVKLLDTLREFLEITFCKKKEKNEAAKQVTVAASISTPAIAAPVATDAEAQPVKRKRGRPRKYPLPEENAQ